MEENDDLVKIVLKMGEKKPTLRIEGMGSIHPIYEALIALLRRHLGDKEIAARFARNEESLREVLFTDIVMDQLTPQNKEQLKTLLISGASLKEVVGRAAVYLSDGKKTQDNQILKNISAMSNNPYFMKSLKAVNPEKVYIETAEIERIEKRSNKKKKNRLTALISASIGIVLCAGTAYFARDYIHINFGQTSISNLEINAKNYSAQISDAKVKIAELKISDEQKKKYLMDLEGRASCAEAETENLANYYIHRQEEMKDFGKKIEELGKK